MENAFSIDVEEYYHASAFESVIQENSWATLESRAERSVGILLDLLAAADTRATFFVLGWLAQRMPALVRRIQAQGHEIASHGYAHKIIYHHTKTDFREDLRRSKGILEDILGQEVIGYRAPSFSITWKSLWALDILIEEGFRYDSSIFPIRHDRYGIPEAPRFTHEIRRNGRSILEFPLSTVPLLGMNLPIAGGGYLRLFPYPLVRWGIQRINTKERQPAVVYCHPWEIDPGQPRQPVPLITRIRHYRNIKGMQEKIRRLLSTFSFRPIREILQRPERNGIKNRISGKP